MALIIEDGSIVPNANSYASVANLDDYAALRGITLPNTDAAKEVLLIKAMDYIEAQESRFKGYRRTQEQSLSWPRTHVVLYYTERYALVNGYENIRQGNYWPDNKIPQTLVKAQCQLAVDVMTVDLQPTIAIDSRSVRRDKVGPLETEYFSSREQLNSPILGKAEGLLANLCTQGMFGLTIGRA